MVVVVLFAASSFAAELLTSHVVLFSSGVGHFERAGTVQGNDSLAELLYSLMGAKVNIVTSTQASSLRCC